MYISWWDDSCLFYEDEIFSSLPPTAKPFQLGAISVGCSGDITSHPGRTGWFSLTVTGLGCWIPNGKVGSGLERGKAKCWRLEFQEKPAGKVVLAPTLGPAVLCSTFLFRLKANTVLALNETQLLTRGGAVRWGERRGQSTGSQPQVVAFHQPLPTLGDTLATSGATGWGLTGICFG